MITGKKFLVLVDIGTVLDPDTGDRIKGVSKGKKFASTVELVGVNTAQLGQIQNFNLAFSVEIYRIHYDNEKYLYFDGNAYEIKTITKAKEERKMLLNVQKSGDAEIKNAIVDWLNTITISIPLIGNVATQILKIGEKTLYSGVGGVTVSAKIENEIELSALPAAGYSNPTVISPVTVTKGFSTADYITAGHFL